MPFTFTTVYYKDVMPRRRKKVQEAREMLSSLPKLRSKMKILEKERELIKEQKKVREEFMTDYIQVAMDLEIAEASMGILSKQEQDIVEKHIIWKYTWNEIMTEYEKEKGFENTLSERSLKRIQENALKKVDEFLRDVKR